MSLSNIFVIVFYSMSFVWLGFGLLKVIEGTSFVVVGFMIMALVFLRLRLELVSAHSRSVQTNKN